MRGYVGLCALSLAAICYSPSFQEVNAQSFPLAVISGQVVDGDSGTGLGPSVVTLSPWFPKGAMADLWQRSESVLSGTDGRFEIRTNLPGTFKVPVAYRVSASYQGRHGEYGARRPKVAGRFLQITPGQQLRGLRVPVWRRGEIAGTVLGEDGRPMAHVLVGAVDSTAVANPWSGDVSQSCFPPHQVTTDDRGRYRFDDLAPGRYLVFVPTRTVSCAAHHVPPPMPGLQDRLGPDPPARLGAVSRAYSSTFARSAVSIESAQVVEVRTGVETPGVDVLLHASPSHTVSGRIAGSCANQWDPTVTLVPSSAPDILHISTPTAFARGGAFRFHEVVSGQYVLHADCSDGSGGRMPIVVSEAQVADIVVPLQPGTPVSGRIESPDGSPLKLGVYAPGFVLEPLERRIPRSGPFFHLSDSGAFSTSVLPGAYWVNARLQDESQVIERITLGGRDIAHTALNIENRGETSLILTVVKGAILTGRLSPAGFNFDARILVFPTDRTRWPKPDPSTYFRLRGFLSTSGRADGTYTAQPLPAGEYFVAAIPEEAARDWPLPSFLDSVARQAVRVRLDRGQNRTLHLRVRER
jgi:hypothetical protein